jgi:hypothetical protein
MSHPNEQQNPAPKLYHASGEMPPARNAAFHAPRSLPGSFLGDGGLLVNSMAFAGQRAMLADLSADFE